MDRLGDERIAAMFAALGLATEDDRRRYSSLANVGVVEVGGEKALLVRCDGETSNGATEGQMDAKLP